MKHNYLEEIKNWKPLSKMDDATEELYLERIQKAYECSLPNEQLVKIPYIGKEEIVEYVYPELIALCPITFFPDIYKITIRIIPNKYIFELKSLKYYFVDFISIPISHEHIASKIYENIKNQFNPKELFVYLETNVRGGLVTNVEIGNKI